MKALGNAADQLCGAPIRLLGSTPWVLPACAHHCTLLHPGCWGRSPFKHPCLLPHQQFTLSPSKPSTGFSAGSRGQAQLGWQKGAEGELWVSEWCSAGCFLWPLLPAPGIHPQIHSHSAGMDRWMLELSCAQCCLLWPAERWPVWSCWMLAWSLRASLFLKTALQKTVGCKY